MASTSSTIEMQNIDGGNFELWKLKMEDIIMDKGPWAAISSTKKASTS